MSLKTLIVFSMLIAIAFISACVQSSNTLDVTAACGMFSNVGIPSSSCPYTNSKINNPSYLTSEFCGSSEKVDLSQKPLVYFKSEYVNSLDLSDLKTTYCEVASETAPKIYRYIRTNSKITHLFFESASPCKDYSVYVLPKTTEVFENFIKPEYIGDMNPEGDTMNIRMTATPVQISKKIITL